MTGEVLWVNDDIVFQNYILLILKVICMFADILALIFALLTKTEI